MVFVLEGCVYEERLEHRKRNEGCHAMRGDAPFPYDGDGGLSWPPPQTYTQDALQHMSFTDRCSTNVYLLACAAAAMP